MANIGNGAVAGQVNFQVTAVSANYTVLPTDELIQVTTGTSVIIVTLPTPVAAGAGGNTAASSAGNPGNQGQRVTVQKADSGNGTVLVKGFLFGKNNSVGVNSQWSQATFICDGIEWVLSGTVS